MKRLDYVGTAGASRNPPIDSVLLCGLIIAAVLKFTLASLRRTPRIARWLKIYRNVPQSIR